MALPRECVCVLTLCAFAMKIFVKESGGERRRMVVGLSCMLFWRWVGGGQTVLVLFSYFCSFSCVQDRMMEESWFFGGSRGG